MKLEFGVSKDLKGFWLDYDPDTDTIDLWCGTCRTPVACYPDRPDLRHIVVTAKGHSANPCVPRAVRLPRAAVSAC